MSNQRSAISNRRSAVSNQAKQPAYLSDSRIIQEIRQAIWAFPKLIKRFEKLDYAQKRQVIESFRDLHYAGDNTHKLITDLICEAESSTDYDRLIKMPGVEVLPGGVLSLPVNEWKEIMEAL